MTNGQLTVTPGTVELEKRIATWHARLLLRNLSMATDLDEALRATDLALSIQPFPDESDIEAEEEPEWDNGNDDNTPVDAAFAFDIFHKKAQGVLNRALEAAKKLSTAARLQFEKALKEVNPSVMAQKVVAFVNAYRVQLARLLGVTQLAAILEGAREAARQVPSIPLDAVIGSLPPSLPPDKAEKLVEKLRQMPFTAREQALYKLPVQEQDYVRRAINLPPPAVPSFLPALEGEGPERILFPIIEQSAKELSKKNLVTREVFDRLDAVARQKAFTVAGVEAQETLGKIRDSISENISEGVDYATWREKVLASVDEGTFLSEPHMETVYRTNVQSQFSDGQMQVLSHPFVRSGFPYAVYDAIHDDRVRENHLALEKYGIDGTNVYRINDPVFETFRPPWDYNDRCGWTAVTVLQAAEIGIKEAKEWLASGVEPSPPAFVDMPPFRPPPGFQRSLASLSLSIRLSLLSVDEFKPQEVSPTELMGDAVPDDMGAGNTVFTQPGDFTKESVKGAPSVDKSKKSGVRSKGKMSKGRAKSGKTGRRLHRGMRVSKKWRRSARFSIELAQHRAPAGYTAQKPLMVQGKGYVGGEFIPGSVMAKATPQEKAAIEGKTAPPQKQQAAQQNKSPQQQAPQQQWQEVRKQAREHVANALGKSGLPSEKKGLYAQAAAAVFDQMSTTAMKRFTQGAGNIHFFDSITGLNNFLVKVGKSSAEQVQAGHMAGGVYFPGVISSIDITGKTFVEHKTPQLLIDGDYVGKGTGSRTTTVELYAHEFMHAIDGPDFEISDSNEWKEAWKAEIVHRHQITEYATTNSQEGLAEFARFYYSNLGVFVGLKDQEERKSIARTYFPKCMAVLESKRII